MHNQRKAQSFAHGVCSRKHTGGPPAPKPPTSCGRSARLRAPLSQPLQALFAVQARLLVQRLGLFQAGRPRRAALHPPLLGVARSRPGAAALAAASPLRVDARHEPRVPRVGLVVLRTSKRRRGVRCLLTRSNAWTLPRPILPTAQARVPPAWQMSSVDAPLRLEEEKEVAPRAGACRPPRSAPTRGWAR